MGIASLPPPEVMGRPLLLGVLFLCLATQISGFPGNGIELQHVSPVLRDIDDESDPVPVIEEDSAENDAKKGVEENKRSPFSFNIDNQEWIDEGTIGRKRDPYAYGLGKRDPYGYGLGKRDPYGYGLGKRDQNGHNLTKRDPYGYGLGKREPYGYGLGKRDPYGYGLGKRDP